MDNQVEELAELQKRSADPNLWNNPNQAREIMQRLSELQDDLNYWRGLKQSVQDTLELDAMDEEEFADELTSETNRLEKELDAAEFKLLLSGEHDRRDAILAIHAGAGGTDSQDWANMLFRMFLRWAEQRNFKTEIYDATDGDGAGMKSVTIGIKGRYAYGYLRSERGVHRLVRLSPFDSNHRRHTSFALIEVWPDIQDEVEVNVDARDLKVDTFRASSAGGQHMQKNDTAVRITHIPSGIIVSCQNERSQGQNRETALRILKSRLVQQQEEEKRKELDELKGEHIDAGWGNQIRSYVLHPYQMVKDHRTNHETGNVQAVLDGSLDNFMEAFLQHTMGQN